MSITHMNVDPETGEELLKTSLGYPIDTQQNHSYNLSPRPTERTSMYNMTQIYQR